MVRSIGTNLDEWESKPLDERFEVWDTVNVCGRDVTFYKPTSEMVLSVVGRLSNFENFQDGLNVLGHVIERADYHHILRALHSGALDPDDLLGDILLPMIEEVTETPTRAASASSRRPSRTGTSSTAGAQRAASTRPRSRRVAPSA